mmetsp:Transcript_9219/g.19994  ORF Transcript_9219/g.19994 Transcript_9219/m.19994 type:complete len:81 (-) Transcript_9219:1792-2034(-)
MCVSSNNNNNNNTVPTIASPVDFMRNNCLFTFFLPTFLSTNIHTHLHIIYSLRFILSKQISKQIPFVQKEHSNDTVYLYK